MKNNHRNWLVFSLAAALVLAVTTASAEPRGGGRLGGPGPGIGSGPGGPGAAFGLLHGPLGDELALTEEQRNTIRGILATQREVAQPWHEDLKNLGAELETATGADPFDEEEVRAIARQMADLQVELAVAHARTAQEVRAVLTPDQREKLGELRAERQAFREQRGRFGGSGAEGRGHRRRGPGGG